MNIISSAFKNNELIPKRYTCDGDGISPPLLIDDIPAETKSLALIVNDPDAPNGDFAHWLVWNINPKKVEVLENGHFPGSIEGLSDSGVMSYVSPCPPGGVHHYLFNVYALDTMLQLDPHASKKDLREAIDGHIIDNTVLTGLYARS